MFNSSLFFFGVFFGETQDFSCKRHVELQSQNTFSLQSLFPFLVPLLITFFLKENFNFILRR